MGLTDRSRLSCRKHRQKKIDNQNRNLYGASTTATAMESTLKPVIDQLSAKEKAWQKYLQAKAIYEETRDAAHWQYLQKCISDYEKTLMSI